MSNQIRIDKGTVVGRYNKGRITPTYPLSGDVYVEAARDEDGCWVYGVGESTYVCAGGLATVVG